MDIGFRTVCWTVWTGHWQFKTSALPPLPQELLFSKNQIEIASQQLSGTRQELYTSRKRDREKEKNGVCWFSCEPSRCFKMDCSSNWLHSRGSWKLFSFYVSTSKFSVWVSCRQVVLSCFNLGCLDVMQSKKGLPARSNVLFFHSSLVWSELVILLTRTRSSLEFTCS